MDRNTLERSMPPWPGGICPQCGEQMPENLIHCQVCRALLNSDLDADSVVIPEFVPLQEITSMIEVGIRGFFVGCPQCDHELRVNHKYVGEQVACKHCSGKFLLNFKNKNIPKVAFYVNCPHCDTELRAAMKYLDQMVECKSCSGQIHFKDQPA